MDVGNFYRYRLQIPQNFGSVILGNLPTRVPLRLLNNAKAPVGMTDFKIRRILGGIGNFYRYRLQILANLSGKHFGWNGRVAKSERGFSILSDKKEQGKKSAEFSPLTFDNQLP